MAATMLYSEPDLKALLCGNDNTTIGAVSAVRIAGKLGKVPIGGCDNTDVIKAMLAGGHIIVTVDQHVDQQAVYGIETALKALTSETLQAKLSGAVETPVDLVTRS